MEQGAARILRVMRRFYCMSAIEHMKKHWFFVLKTPFWKIRVFRGGVHVDSITCCMRHVGKIMHGAFSVECVFESICMGNRTNTKPQCYGCCIIPCHVCLHLCCVACLFVSTWRCMETHRQREHRYTPSTCSKSFACESPSHDAAGPQACAASTTKQLHAS